MADYRQFQYPFGVGDGIDPELIAPLLGLWRVREHGEATAALHGPEGLSKEALYRALDRTKDVNFPYKSVEEALIPIDADGRPLVVRTFKRYGVEYIVGTARLRHAPYEAVAVIARKIDGRYRVVGISSFVDR
ncbi:MAG: hypothetical protein HC872_05275 [Gammaproteobacteria bacterium]|nr:hypothetical protein [Gammaproteobacteria bacterium]